MEKITPSQEKLLLKAAQGIINDVAHGSSTLKAAITKSAMSNDLNAPMLSRVVEAVNIALTKNHLQKSSGADRAASFDVASPEDIVSTIMGSPDNPVIQKAASRSEPVYTETRYFKGTEPKAKVGKEYTPEVPLDTLYKRAEKVMSRAYSELDRISKTAHSNKRKVFRSVDSLGEYFTGVYREPFSKVEEAAIAKYGSRGEDLMTCVWNMLGPTRVRNEKRASGAGEQAVNWDQAPYFMIADAIDSTDTFKDHLKQANDLLSQIKEGEDKLKSFFTKRGGILSLVSAPLHIRHLIQQRELEKEKQEALGADEKATRRRVSEQFGPTQDKIRSLSVLSDIMERDDIVSKADPEHVVELYTDILSIAPALAQNRALLTSALRKGIEYEPDIMEYQNLLKTDTDLFKRDLLGPSHLSRISDASGEPKVSL